MSLDDALALVETLLPDGWSLLMGHDENADWWATASEPRGPGHHGYRIISSSHDSFLYGSASEALLILAALLPAHAPAHRRLLDHGGVG